MYVVNMYNVKHLLSKGFNQIYLVQNYVQNILVKYVKFNIFMLSAKETFLH